MLLFMLLGAEMKKWFFPGYGIISCAALQHFYVCVTRKLQE